MSQYAEVKSTTRTVEDGAHNVSVVCDPGGGALLGAELVGAPGEDSLPLPGDFVAIADVEGQGQTQAFGFIDTENLGKAEPGEVRRYSRNAAGVPVAEIYLRKDGAIQINSLAANQPIVIHATGAVQLISDSDDIRLGQGGAKIATVGSIVSGSIIVPSLGTPTPFAGQVISGLPGASGG